MKVQLSEAMAELNTVKEAAATSEFVSGNTAAPEYVLCLIPLSHGLPRK